MKNWIGQSTIAIFKRLNGSRCDAARKWWDLSNTTGQIYMYLNKDVEKFEV